MLLVRIASNVLRVGVLIAIILGILLWTGNYDALKPIHMLVGIIIVAALWTIGTVQAATKGGSMGLAWGAFILGIILAVLGMTQENLLPGSAHVVIQIIHLLLGLTAAGLGEMMAARYKRLTSAKAVQAQ